METCNVLFQPEGLRAHVRRGTLISDAVKTLGIPILLPCSGKGTCGKCIVEILTDAPEPGDYDRLHLSEQELERGMRLACQTRIDRDMRILIRHEISVFDRKILVEGIDRSYELDSMIHKTYVKLPEPSLHDQLSDVDRIIRTLRLTEVSCDGFDIDLIRELPLLLRNAGYKVTVVTFNGRVIAIEPGNTTERVYGIAFDLGTTTVVGTILNLINGQEMAYASRLNTQAVYGEDTISRIKYVIETPDAQHEMSSKIRDVINEIITEAAGIAGIKTEDIYEAVFVGNTTMSHLFLGFDPRGLSQIPFVSATNSAVNLRARDTGIIIHPNGNLYVLPNIAGFVGSDTVGVMLACNYLEHGLSQLAVDIGTNGELALKRDDTIMVCSTAAGPAFEGVSLTCGMSAVQGAIEHVRINREGIENIEYDVIGNTVPTGLCGSGIIDMLAVLLEAGIVDKHGTLIDRDKMIGNIPYFLLERIITVDEQRAFLISRGTTGDKNSRDVVLTQRDIRQVQLAKGAISAGIHLILKEMSMTVEDLDEILLAGAFGNYMNKINAQRIGLLPPIPAERIRFVGNAASTGAKMALLSHEIRKDADRIRLKTRHLELAALPEFMNELTENMLFP